MLVHIFFRLCQSLSSHLLGNGLGMGKDLLTFEVKKYLPPYLTFKGVRVSTQLSPKIFFFLVSPTSFFRVEIVVSANFL